MQLYKARDSWIVNSEKQSLWFNRRSLIVYSKPEALTEHILTSTAWNCLSIGEIFGYIGQVQFVNDGVHWLIFIKSRENICKIQNQHEIYRITEILIHPFEDFDEDSSNKFNPKNEFKFIEEFRIWYQETQCFYYSPTYDLTNSYQRSFSIDQTIPLWKRADEQFFWNRQMLSELIDQAEKDHLNDDWIQPIIMGYLNECHFEINEQIDIHLVLISRRNRHRAGVRMHCRGIDNQGNVANYVETEQIVWTGMNVMSFVMIRGSVPIYWSQPGIKYRPPPKIDRNFSESHEAFVKHMEVELSRTKGQQLILITLVDEWGKETVLNDAYYDHVIKYNCAKLSYIAFDFHEYCKGLQFGNVLTLLQLLEEKNIFREMRFSWINIEKNITLSEQISVFRINCVDCLDRTNVVQAAIAKTCLEIMLKKLGLLDLDGGGLNGEARVIFQTMWADNGDAISRQYAGTDAMKGDFTRTGRRDIKGVLADGKISANRYYRRLKKDTLRQQCYDAMQKQFISTSKNLNSELDLAIEPAANREEILKQMILECKKMFVSEETEECFGIWPLIDDSDLNEVLIEQNEPDCVLVLTSNRYFVVCYDETFQKVVSFKEMPLTSVEKVEVGPNPLSPAGSSWTLRIHYFKDEQTSGYYHQFRGTVVQVFNSNTVMFMKSTEEINDYLKTIGQMIVAIITAYAQKPISLAQKTLTKMNSLPDDVEPLQRRMSFSATDTPPLSVLNGNSTATTTTQSNLIGFDKLRTFGSKVSSLVTRQAAPTINKLTTQAKALPINETVNSFLKVINEGQSLIRSSGTTRSSDDDRASPTLESNRKKLLQDKYDERKKDLINSNCQSTCFLLPSADLNLIYIPNNTNHSK